MEVVLMRVRLNPEKWGGKMPLDIPTLEMCLIGSGLTIVGKPVLDDGRTLITGNAAIWPEYYENSPGSSWWVEELESSEWKVGDRARMVLAAGLKEQYPAVGSVGSGEVMRGTPEPFVLFIPDDREQWPPDEPPEEFGGYSLEISRMKMVP